ncbi:uncharacterized protein PGTG_13679 [Puccinia graminis f. sp. tritici CRL 75-36-700-3]|uniref:Uncharacterized protein n=1 Tax=Puccinia graminis f. sp. tritici (strain CRL 75-36-700-3 / race SCCL) TaxID=418459 RepID=E3KSS1_PUCGT|nr:uncharacterized protein PGTG_13679 [Puccinia graminis f. sp. tritici CRL 75-36-700-3]EFP87451.1 hypothetical protein PGTG_13679 [Puccinia graminis f. sp. tritici CRL 75-36-700-3]
MCLAGHLEGGYLRISAQIPAKAGGYPPADADNPPVGLGVNPPRPTRVWGLTKQKTPTEAAGRIPPSHSDYTLMAEEPPQLLCCGSAAGGRDVALKLQRGTTLPTRVPKDARREGSSRRAGCVPARREGFLPASVHRPTRREEPLPASWFLNQLAGRGSSRRAGLCTSSSGGVPPGELVLNQLVGRNPSQRASTGQLPACREGFLPASVHRPTRWEKPLPASWFLNQLAGRGSSRRAASPPIQRAGIRGYPRGYPPTLAGIRWRMRMCVSAEIVSGYPHPRGYPDSMRPSLAGGDHICLLQATLGVIHTDYPVYAPTLTAKPVKGFGGLNCKANKNPVSKLQGKKSWNCVQSSFCSAHRHRISPAASHGCPAKTRSALIRWLFNLLSSPPEAVFTDDITGGAVDGRKHQRCRRLLQGPVKQRAMNCDDGLRLDQSKPNFINDDDIRC